MCLEDNHKKLSLLFATLCYSFVAACSSLRSCHAKGSAANRQFKLLVTENLYIFCLLWSSTFGAVEEEQSLLLNSYSLLPFLNQLSSVYYVRLLPVQELIIQSTAIKILLYSAVKADHTDSKTCVLIT